MGEEQRKDKGDGSTKTYVVQVDMHCECSDCIKKITDGIKEIRLSEGVERAELVADTGEVKVVGTMNPERFCRLLHELTKKSVRIVTQSNLSDGRIATSEQINNLFQQASSCDWFLGREASGSGWRNGERSVRPSAPPLPAEEKEWSEAVVVPSERCWYRWPARGSSTLGVWAASDVTGTLAMYEL